MNGHRLRVKDYPTGCYVSCSCGWWGWRINAGTPWSSSPLSARVRAEKLGKAHVGAKS